MNEALIKNIIKLKLDVANAIIESLPKKMSADVRNFGRIILESANESFQEKKEQPAKKMKPKDTLENVTIE